MRLIRDGYADLVIAGGSEAATIPLTVAAFAQMTALTKNPDPETASRPFDAERNGFVLSEGGCALILESGGPRRGARRAHLLRGRGLRRLRDAHHITAPDPKGSGAALAMRGPSPTRARSRRAVDYVNAHGTSTPLNDAAETAAIKTRARRGRACGGRLLDEVDDRSHARRGGRGRGRGVRARDRQRPRSRPRSTTRRPTPTATSTSRRTRRASSTSAWRCRTPSGSVARTPRSRSGRSLTVLREGLRHHVLGDRAAARVAATAQPTRSSTRHVPGDLRQRPRHGAPPRRRRRLVPVRASPGGDLGRRRPRRRRDVARRAARRSRPRTPPGTETLVERGPRSLTPTWW